MSVPLLGSWYCWPAWFAPLASPTSTRRLRVTNRLMRRLISGVSLRDAQSDGEYFGVLHGHLVLVGTSA